MSYSYTTTESFTITHARRLASKVSTDMLLCNRYYGDPTESKVRDFAEELAQLLKAGYAERYEFGYKKDGNRVVCWRYEIAADGSITSDDPPGKLASSANIQGASFYNYLWHSDAWRALPEDDRKVFEDGLPIQRVACDSPNDGSGQWVSDKSYSASGVSMSRSTFRPE